MTSAWLPVALPIAALAACTAGQVLAFRLLPGGSLLRSLGAGFSVGLLALAAGTWSTWETHGATPLDRAAAALANLILYAALGYGYFHFVNLGETARRIRLLRELAESPAPLTEAELLARYDGGAIVAVRLDRLVRKGQLRLVDGRYRPGAPTLLLAARLLVALKVLFLGRRTERG